MNPAGTRRIRCVASLVQLNVEIRGFFRSSRAINRGWSEESPTTGAPEARPAGAERGEGVPASDGDGGSGGAKPPGLMIEYGLESPTTIAWDDAAAERMKKIPA